MSISVIIPTYNEGNAIMQTIQKVKINSKDGISEIILADGKSTDDTVAMAEAAGATAIRCSQTGRAVQMNHGAKQARGEILYFLHADTHPPPNFDTSIHQAISDGYSAGCFRLTFDDEHWLLRSFAWFTRFDIDWFRFGDQSLFMKKAVFNNLHGFREDHRVMEDQEMVKRIKKTSSFKIMDDEVLTSARKYRENGILTLQMVFLLVFCLYYAGVDQKKLAEMYKRLLNK